MQACLTPVGMEIEQQASIVLLSISSCSGDVVEVMCILGLATHGSDGDERNDK